MELAQCIESVYAEKADWIQIDSSRILFKEGHVYPIFRDHNYWLATDEEGEHHIVADSPSILEDHWFRVHFRKL